jgi:simple sugar transport system ATP-binding protein
VNSPFRRNVKRLEVFSLTKGKFAFERASKTAVTPGWAVASRTFPCTEDATCDHPVSGHGFARTPFMPPHQMNVNNPVPASVEPHALRMLNIEKYFGLVRALTNINLEVGRNEIVGLIGDNGAGKSTMVKILTGVFPPTSGELYVAGRKVDFRRYNVQSAHAHGIETVYQDKSLGEKQVLWRNFFIGRQIVNRFGFINVKKEKAIANEIMVNTIGFRSKGITVDSNVSQLSGGERQGIAIGRAMHFEADLIILDEPTVALSLKEVAKVINFVHKIKEGGKASIYISHSIPDVYEVSDRFIVLDRGEIGASIPKKDISLKDLDGFLLEYAHGLKDKEQS